MGARNGDRNLPGGDRALLDRGYGFYRRGDRWLPDRWMGMPYQGQGPGSPPSPQLLSTLISYWKLDEAAGVTKADSVGTNHLPDPTNCGTFAAKINNGAYFSGTANVLTHASNASLQVTGDFTFSIWFRFDGGGTYIAKGDLLTPPADYLLDFSVDRFRFGKDTVNYVAAIVTPTLFTWHHIVAWFDSGDGTFHLRLDDATSYVSSSGLTLVQTAGPFTIGALTYSGSPANFGNGIYDEVGFWKRKLTAAEITALYNGGAGLPFSSFT